jgi:uncharacterized tellurite resistance protein B-like protein
MPEDWTPEHSVAVVLIGMAMIDGQVDESEMRALVDVIRGIPGIKEVSSHAVGWQAYKHLSDLHSGGQDRLFVGTLRHHGTRLSNHYSPSVLQSIMERLEVMADADGQIHPMERRLMNAFQASWKLDDQPS